VLEVPPSMFGVDVTQMFWDQDSDPVTDEFLGLVAEELAKPLIHD
jgi:hypothetical protein